NRIHALDGLRVISILMVMVYHYYYRFDGVKYKYPFHSAEILYYGKLGVALFFVISGFVITLTLTHCNNLLEFVKKRFIRLIPAMFICTFVTYLIFTLFDNNSLFPASSDFRNLIVSNTFIKPSFFNRIFGLNLEYIDGAYWSIWIELQFYMIAGVLYFLSPKNLLRSFAIYSAITTTYFLYNKFNVNHLHGSVSYIYGHYDLWFLSGIIVNKLYTNPKSHINLVYLTVVIAVQMFIQSNTIAIFCSAIIALIFIAFVYKQEYLSFLESRFLGRIGIATYSIYLIHQNDEKKM
ncbi:MAG: acyltransferase, partial [Flavobacterium sp.]